jgi:hypothetical protein
VQEKLAEQARREGRETHLHFHLALDARLVAQGSAGPALYEVPLLIVIAALERSAACTVDKSHCIVTGAILAGLVLAGQDLAQAAQCARLLGVHEPFILHDAVRPCPERVGVLRRVLGDA